MRDFFGGIKEKFSRIASAPTATGVNPVLKSVVLSMVRNEQDIVEPFLRHNARLVDLMIVLDNLSTDRTHEIVTRTARELGNVVVTDWPDRAYGQAETMTQLFEAVQTVVFADFVFFLDADEFLNVPDTGSLQSALSELSPGETGLMPWQTWIPNPEETEGEDPLLRIKLRRKTEAPQFHKAIFRAGGGTFPGAGPTQGNHDFRQRSGKKFPSKALKNLSLIHIPLRSKANLHSKGVVGWLANEERGKHGNGATPKKSEAFQWRRLKDLHQAGVEISDELLAEEALGYTQDPREGPLGEHVIVGELPLKYERKFSDGSFGDPEALIQAARAPKRDPEFKLPPPPKTYDVSAQVTNAFEGAWHWDHLFLDQAPIALAIELLQPTSIIDIGCGNGVYPKLYEHLGVKDILGVDGIEPEATVLNSENYQRIDLQEPYDAGRTFDLAVCLEVLEHIEPQATDTALDSIARHAKDAILFSMAEPGQPGNGHINCRDMAFVLDAWADRGWYPDLSLTLGLRALATMSWFRRNIVLLRRDVPDRTGASDALKAIGGFPYKWWSQAPGLRSTAFRELYPNDRVGYGHRKP